jgi:chaperone modulatory protein CbpM
MIDAPQFLIQADLDAKTLEAWVAVGWLKPRRNSAGWWFSESHLVRARLLHDLTRNLRVNETGVKAVIDLLDQISRLRRMLRAMLSVARALPEPLRRRVAAEVVDREDTYRPNKTFGVGGTSGEPRSEASATKQEQKKLDGSLETTLPASDAILVRGSRRLKQDVNDVGMAFAAPVVSMIARSQKTEAG